MIRDTVLAEALRPLAEQKFKGDCRLLLAALNQNHEFKKTQASRRLDGAALISKMERLRDWLAATQGIRFIVRGTHWPEVALRIETQEHDNIVFVLTDSRGKTKKIVGHLPAEESNGNGRNV